MLGYMLLAIQIALPVAILTTTLAILYAVKRGFNEVIKGLEAISDRMPSSRE